MNETGKMSASRTRPSSNPTRLYAILAVLLVVVIVVVSILFVVRGIPALKKGEQPTPEPVSLKVVVLPLMSYAPYFIAEDEGFFAEQGLKIDFVRMERSSDAIPALAKGELDVVAGALNASLLNAIARGGAIKAVADKGYVDPKGCAYTALVGRRDLVEKGELDSAAELQGRKIDLNPAGFEAYYVDKWLSGFGLSVDDLEVLDIPRATEVESMGNGSLDLISTSEPWLTRMIQSGKGVVLLSDYEIIPDFQVALVLYGPTILGKNPDMGRRFMVAYLKGVRQYNQGKTGRNLDILAKYTELERELLAQACWPPVRSDGQISVRSVLDFQDWAVKTGLLDSPVTEDQLVDLSFIEQANKVLGASNP